MYSVIFIQIKTIFYVSLWWIDFWRSEPIFKRFFRIVILDFVSLLNTGLKTLHIPHTFPIVGPQLSEEGFQVRWARFSELKNVQAFLMGYSRKIQKIFNIDIIQSNSPLRVFEPFNYESGHRKFLRYTIGGLYIDLSENFNIYIWPWNNLNRLIQVPRSWFWLWKTVIVRTWGSTGRFYQKYQLAPLRVKLHIRRL